MEHSSKKCRQCGRPINVRHISRLYCSQTCRQYAYLERKGSTTALQGVGNQSDYNNPSNNQGSIIEELTAFIKQQSLLYQQLQEKVDRLTNQIEQMQQSNYSNEKYSEMPFANKVSIDTNDVSEDVINTFKSSFLRKVEKFMEENAIIPEQLEIDLDELAEYEKDEAIVNTNKRLKPVLLALLSFSYKRTVPVCFIKQLYTQTDQLLKSRDYQQLPERYRLGYDLQKLSDQLKSIVDRSGKSQNIVFYLSPETKVEIISYIYSMGTLIDNTRLKFVENTAKDSKSMEDNMYYKRFVERTGSHLNFT